MTSMQEPAPGSKSSKFVTTDPLDPIRNPFGGDEGDNNNNDGSRNNDVQRTVAENVNRRLVQGMEELKEKHRTGQIEMDDPDRAPTGPAYQMADAVQRHKQKQQQQQQKQQQLQAQQDEDEKRKKDAEQQRLRQQNGDDDNGDDDASDYDYLLDEDNDEQDPVLLELRQRRIQEMKQKQIEHAHNIALGHGQYRTIAQDEFLPECNGRSRFVCVHFYHDEFRRCQIMDHHLRIAAERHPTCKFVRINAAKAPFFVSKLNVQTLPTVLVFEHGKVVQRLIGFDGLVSKDPKDPDQWDTSQLQQWLATTGAIEYRMSSAPPSNDMERLKIQSSIYRGGVLRHYDDDDN